MLKLKMDYINNKVNHIIGNNHMYMHVHCIITVKSMYSTCDVTYFGIIDKYCKVWSSCV